ncbi:MAG: hypothetical protein WAK55_17485 [Xanthobacteraceae bacterium]
MELTTMDGIVANIKETVENIGSGLAHDEDWAPVLCLYGKNPAIILMPGLAESVNSKDVFATEIIPKLITDGKPDFVSFTTMGWMKQYDPSTLEGAAEQARDEAKYSLGNIADRPGKAECLCIHIVGKDGAERQLMAYVHRNPTLHPTLQWFMDNSADAKQSAGRFPDALRAGMEAAWKK